MSTWMSAVEIIIPVMVAIITAISGIAVARISAVQKNIQVSPDKSRDDDDTIGSRVDLLSRQVDQLTVAQTENLILHSSFMTQMSDMDRRIDVIQEYLLKGE